MGGLRIVEVALVAISVGQEEKKIPPCLIYMAFSGFGFLCLFLFLFFG